MSFLGQQDPQQSVLISKENHWSSLYDAHAAVELGCIMLPKVSLLIPLIPLIAKNAKKYQDRSDFLKMAILRSLEIKVPLVSEYGINYIFFFYFCHLKISKIHSYWKLKGMQVWFLSKNSFLGNGQFNDFGRLHGNF